MYITPRNNIKKGFEDIPFDIAHIYRAVTEIVILIYTIRRFLGALVFFSRKNFFFCFFKYLQSAFYKIYIIIFCQPLPRVSWSMHSEILN